MATKTDNDYLMDKAQLRADAISGDVSVLDAFGGKGLVWELVRRISGHTIKRTAIDKRHDLTDFHLHGDNTKIMSGMDLSIFDVVDLDAYGVPYDQLRCMFEQRYKGIVFITFIQTMNGIMPSGLLEDVGFSREIVKKTPALFARRGWDYFREWLALNGVTKITHRSRHRKHYLWFSDAGEPVAGFRSRQEDNLVSLF